MRRFLMTMAGAAVVAVAAITFTAAPVPAGAQSAQLAAPVVSTAASSSCNPERPKTYLIASYTAVAEAESYEYRVKWGRNTAFTEWRTATRKPGDWWAVSSRHYLNPGEQYVVQVRALDEDDRAGPTGTDRYSYSVSAEYAPTDVAVAYAEGSDGEVDYTKARLTWRGDDGSGDWFAVQRRVIGHRWQGGGWQHAQKTGDYYYRDVSGLDASEGYEFRVTAHTPDCQTSPWSEVATLWPAPDPPSFETSIGNADEGAMLGVWIPEAQSNADYHTFRLGDGSPVTVRGDVAQHVFDVAMGNDYEVCATAGNARGESAATCRIMTAQAQSPIAELTAEASEHRPGALSVYWRLVPVVNPTWFDDDEGSTHAPPAYRVAIREAGSDAWPSADTEYRVEYQEGRQGGATFDGLKGDTEYQIAVQSGYYGESSYATATARTLMHPVRNLRVGFSEDDDRKAVVTWEAPYGGGQAAYGIRVFRTFVNRAVDRQTPAADATAATASGLKPNKWYHVKVRATGASGQRSAAVTCYFRQGHDGSQNGTAARWTGGPSCAAE